MDCIYMKARAKINLALDVLSKRPDGYHEMKMVMQTLRLYDGIYIKRINKPKIKLACECKWLPLDEKNLVYKAAQVLIDKYSITDGVFIEINKVIPVSAGLAGGSSDCAATLLGMKKLFNLPISRKELLEIGKSLGADIPYCLTGGTILAEGIGEKLTHLPSHPNVSIVLVKPPIKVSTAFVFENLNLEKIKIHPNIDKMISCIQRQNLEGISNEFINVLETVTEEMHPIITDIKEILLSYNAIGTLMSGSGPTVFAYFRKREEALRAIEGIKASNPEIHEIFLTSIYNPNRKGMIV